MCGRGSSSHPVPVCGAAGTGFCLSELTLRAVLSGPRSTLTLRWDSVFCVGTRVLSDTPGWGRRPVASRGKGAQNFLLCSISRPGPKHRQGCVTIWCLVRTSGSLPPHQAWLSGVPGSRSCALRCSSPGSRGVAAPVQSTVSEC